MQAKLTNGQLFGTTENVDTFEPKIYTTTVGPFPCASLPESLDANAFFELREFGHDCHWQVYNRGRVVASGIFPEYYARGREMPAHFKVETTDVKAPRGKSWVWKRGTWGKIVKGEFVEK